MSDERSRVVLASGLEPTDGIEELEDLEGFEDLDEGGSDTGAFTRTSTSVRAPARSSVPPPIPSQAQRSASSPSLPPPRMSLEGDAPTESQVTRAPSSGMFRIERTSTFPIGSAPPAPAGHSSVPPMVSAERLSRPAPRTSAPPPPSTSSEPAELKRALSAATRDLREHASQIHRLRLMVRLREDTIAELEAKLKDRSASAERNVRELEARAEQSAQELRQGSELDAHALRERAERAEAAQQSLRERAERAELLEQAIRERAANAERAESAARERAVLLERELSRVLEQRTADDLKRISGIGPGFERALHANGVTSFAQIAAWTPTEVERIAREIRTTPRRIARDRWIERARELARGEPAQARASDGATELVAKAEPNL